MTEFYWNGMKVTEEEMNQLANAQQEYMIENINAIRDVLEVSEDTASAIHYLRTRSRWTEEKEQELIDRDRVGNPIPLHDVLSGEF